MHQPSKHTLFPSYIGLSTKAVPLSPPSPKVLLKQVHGNRTVVVREESHRLHEADGALTDTPNISLCIRIADCQGFCMIAPTYGIIGVLHVGWRGLIADAIPEFFATARAEWNTPPEAFTIYSAPSLCIRCAEFSDPHKELPNIDSSYMHNRHVDLRRVAYDQFCTLGVSASSIHQHPDCTQCNSHLYWTYRGGDRNVVQKGNGNVLWVTHSRNAMHT